jgi:hypothetical protein
MAKAAVKRVKPFTDKQHEKMGDALAELGCDLMDMQDSILKSYAHSTEPARAVREMIRAYNRTRGALVSRFFGEGHSTDGTSPYYPQGMKLVKPAEPGDCCDADDKDEEEPTDGEPE